MTPGPLLTRTRLAAALALAVACDSNLTVHALVTVPEEVAAAYSETERGLLVVRFDTEDDAPLVVGLAMICGEAVSLGALQHEDGARRPATKVQAWIEPARAGDTRPCGFLAVGDLGLGDITPGPDAPQAETSLADSLGCGSDVAEVALVLAPPA